jgi:hypothetical protein
MIVGYYETHSNADQDAERLACRLTGALEIFILPSDIENAFNWLDELAQLERGNHYLLEVNDAGTVDNTETIVAYLEGELQSAIQDVVSGFRTHWELAA